jgi:purine-binding chemotaxis protein CheW
LAEDPDVRRFAEASRLGTATRAAAGAGGAGHAAGAGGAGGAAGAGGAGGAAGADGAGCRYLTFSAPGELAVPLEQVSEVVPVPAERIATGGRPGLLGVVHHRGAAVPLLCLATLLGRTAEPVMPCVLVVDAGGGATVGFVVDRLRSIETSAWRRPHGTDTHIVRMRERPGPVTEVDLRALARAAVRATP